MPPTTFRCLALLPGVGVGVAVAECHVGASLACSPEPTGPDRTLRYPAEDVKGQMSQMIPTTDCKDEMGSWLTISEYGAASAKPVQFPVQLHTPPQHAQLPPLP